MEKYRATGIVPGPKTVTLERVSKSTARRLHAQGKAIYLQSSNMRLFNMWQTPYEMPDKTRCEAEGETFDSIVQNYQWYNCDNERGRYASFFVEV